MIGSRFGDEARAEVNVCPKGRLNRTLVLMSGGQRQFHRLAILALHGEGAHLVIDRAPVCDRGLDAGQLLLAGLGIGSST